MINWPLLAGYRLVHNLNLVKLRVSYRLWYTFGHISDINTSKSILKGFFFINFLDLYIYIFGFLVYLGRFISNDHYILRENELTSLIWEGTTSQISKHFLLMIKELLGVPRSTETPEPTSDWSLIPPSSASFRARINNGKAKLLLLSKVPTGLFRIALTLV